MVIIGGGYFFIGDTNSRFKALDQQSGEVFWETILSKSIIGLQPGK
ncbi:MAG: hypothetical protein HKN08_00260 [Gammaproteobacteria bacterium]|nr:hypothetical protein [Gammaproteobacteria bacterium]